jgi:LacI family transcriptional regulator
MPQGRQTPARLIDVAEKAGVSLTTASFAMSGRPGVSEAVAERVRAIAAELGYVPNMQARSLASGASSTVGLLVHDIADPYFAELASAVVASAADLGLTVQICQSSRDPEQEITQVRTLVASRVRALIMAGSGRTGTSDARATYDELERFQSTGGRVAMIGRHRTPLDAVVPDNAAGGAMVGVHLRDLGHTQVGIVAGPDDLASAADRLRGVTEALTADSERVDLHVEHSAFDHAGGEAAAERLLTDHPNITALVALNDSMAAGVLATTRRRGLDVPGDISVTGFDDVRVAADLGPGLTTVRLPLHKMGTSAVALAMKPPATRARRVQVPVELVVRGSTGLRRR